MVPPIKDRRKTHNDWNSKSSKIPLASRRCSMQVSSKSESPVNLDKQRRLAQAKLKKITKLINPTKRPELPYQNTVHEVLPKLIASAPVREMPRSLRRNISKRLPHTLTNASQELSTQLISDVEQHYVDATVEIGLHCKLAGEVRVDPISMPVIPFRLESFKKTQKKIEDELWIIGKFFRPVMLHLLKLPGKLIDLDLINDLDQFEKDLNNRKITYIKAVYSVIETKRLSPSLLVRMLRVISMVIQGAMEQAVENFLLNLKPVSDFELDVVNSKAVLVPGLVPMIEKYFKVIVLIGKYYQKVNFYTVDPIIKISIPSSRLDEFKIKLTERIFDFFKPFTTQQEAMNSLLANFWGNGETPVGGFDEIHDKIMELRLLFKTVVGMDYKLYFECGVLTQILTLTNILENIKKIIRKALPVLGKMVAETNQQLFSEFQECYDRIQVMGTTVIDLIKNGEYVLYVKSVFLPEMEERIKPPFIQVLRLMEISIVSEKQVDDNCKLVKWIPKILLALNENSSFYEHRKLNFQEDVRKILQNLNIQRTGFEPLLPLLNNMTDARRAKSYLRIIKPITEKIQDFERKLSFVNTQETFLKHEKTAFPGIQEDKETIYKFYDLLYLCANWYRIILVWMDGPFENIDVEKVDQVIENHYKKAQNTQKGYKSSLKKQIIEKNPKRFSGSVDDHDITKLCAPLQLTKILIEDIKEFRPVQQVIRIFRNDALLKRHYNQMSEILKVDVTPHAGTTIRKLMKLPNVNANLNELELISVSATKELNLRNLLKQMIEDWKSINFKTLSYKETGLQILTQLDDVQAVLDDHLVKTLSMKGSVFVKPISQNVNYWYSQLNRLNATLEYWGAVQVQWCYLLPIFTSKDIVSQMPVGATLFNQVDASIKRYMQQVKQDPNVFTIATSVGITEEFKKNLTLLEQINEIVVNYLEQKRLFFPRFFFLTNEEMLEILSETKDPLRVQPHLHKCFEGISKLDFDPELVIRAMISKEGEVIRLTSPIPTEQCKGTVEQWLLQVESEMVSSVRHQIFQSRNDYNAAHRTNWIQIWPGQVILCVSQIFWAVETQNCLHARRLSELTQFQNVLRTQLNNIVSLVRSPDLTNLARISIRALIVIDVHAADVVQNLINNRIDDAMSFLWLSQLRYYWINDDVAIKIINSTVQYAYEYLGNSDRLVITPLTDRCYRTLIGAYQLHLNGAPEGPAGTGKTETTKDLAKALAVQCIVFNCSDGLDYKGMGKFFKGLASTGAWACFDEFNRIDLEVLSVVGQQISCIIMAIRAAATTFVFEGTTLKLNPACYVCITMNPGYAGRSELPDNLKVLFRTVAMMVPDYAMIAEISLYSSGFLLARELAVKIVTTYRLCSEQLSSQSHYDYGMRAVKSVLQAAANLMLTDPTQQENILILKSIKDVNLPKFVAADVPLFEGIVSDIFPGVELPVLKHAELIENIHETTKKMNLQLVEGLITKIIQTYEMMIVRHGFMLVGEPFGGKTTCLRVLAESLRNVQFETINPKSITIGQLYGQFDSISHEWSDGILATTFRNFATDPSNDRKWVIFDGPVDAVWIENLNTVLDDNKKLCLMSGEVIAMTPVMSMIFEVMDLAQASPATVSRCGMIFMEPNNIGWPALLKSWLSSPNINSFDIDYISTLFEYFIPLSLQFISKNCTKLCYAGDVNLLKSTLILFEMLTMETASDESSKQFEQGWFQASLISSILWGLTGTLDQPSLLKFDEFFRSLWLERTEKLPFQVLIPLPGDGLYMDYFFVYRMRGSWKYWPEEIKTTSSTSFHNQTLVTTLDVARIQYLMGLHVKYHKRALLIGETGTGKTFYMNNLLLKQIEKEKFEPGFITFTVHLSAEQAQNLLLTKLTKLKRGHYGPHKGKHAVVFIDDINLPVKDTYGSQPPIELLRQFFDHQNCFNLKDTTKIFIYELTILAAMGPVGGSRQEIYQRFLRHFNLYAMHPFNDDSCYKIFSSILMASYQLNGYSTEILPSVMFLVKATLSIYRSAVLNLRPTPLKSHYMFNLRDFARVIQGCGLMRKESGDEKSIFFRLWVHEVLRVFYDRLIDDADRLWLFKEIELTMKNIFKTTLDQTLQDLTQHEPFSELTLKNLLFGSYIDLDSLPEERRYEQIPTFDNFLEIANTALQDYNSTHKTKMDIVLFRYTLEHLSKICRILRMPGNSGLLIGISGCGRQSLCRLAATLLQYDSFQPEISHNYGLNEWRSDIKKILKQCGGQGRNTLFLFGEMQVKEEAFLEDLDALLNSGEVPNIYGMDEQQEILEMCRLKAQGGNRNLDIDVLEVFAYFRNRCKDMLHVMLCFSPIGSTLRTRIRLYPSFVNCCTIDWFEDWPENALEMVAKTYIDRVSLPKEVKTGSIQVFKYFHLQARILSNDFYSKFNRKTYVTSASYLGLIKSFTELCEKKQQEILDNRTRYLVGLEQLEFAAEQVTVMQKDLNELHPKLVEMALKTEQMMAASETEREHVEKTRALVKSDEEEANAQAEASQALKDECEADLSVAMPALIEAESALNTLKPSDITLLKTMNNPPTVVKIVMEAVCIMKGVAPDRVRDPQTSRMVMDYWGPSKRLLGDIQFLQSLKDYDKDNIPSDVIERIRKEYLTNKSFKPEIVAKASAAAEGMCKWIIALSIYDKVVKVVVPKKAKLAIAEATLNQTLDLLKSKREMLHNLESSLAVLNEQIEEITREKNKTQDAVELCTQKLARAEKLISGLGGEKVRWKQTAESLAHDYICSPGDMLLSCGIISYLAPFTLEVRMETVQKWSLFIQQMNIPCSQVYILRKILGSDIKIQTWQMQGLPNDNFSTDNAIIMDTSLSYSLLIDPQRQGNLWIRTMEKKNKLHVVKFTDANYMKQLEHCIEFGKPILIENVLDYLDKPIDPVLERRTFIQNGVEYITLGDTVIEFDKQFRLYLTTTLPNPHYQPEVFNKVTVVNFVLTLEGLQDQLLGIVVAKDRPDLQEKRQHLIEEGYENRVNLKETEMVILKTLNENKKDILENQLAADILDSSKKLSEDIIKKQDIAKDTEVKIEASRVLYQPIAKHAAHLYYCVCDLPNVDPMYQYSLSWYINLYISSIANAPPSTELDKRIKILISSVEYDLYTNVSRALFQRDKLLFSFILYTKIMRQKIDPSLFNWFLGGDHQSIGHEKNPAPEWLTDDIWNQINQLSNVPQFKSINILDLTAWKYLYDSSHPTNFPDKWNHLPNFEKLVILKTIRPDKTISMISQVIVREIGSKFVKPPAFDIDVCFKDSNYMNPLIFILSPGVDPMQALQRFAEQKRIKLSSISLGQGQGPIASALIAASQVQEEWVCLQNCHLAESWMSTLEKICDNFDYTNTHPDFRLWLTSYPSSKFPKSVLQNGLKMTNEPPEGLKLNVLRTYTSDPMNNTDFYNSAPGTAEAVFHKLLFGLTVFHAVVQERRTFGPMGWNIAYGFNESDFEISVLQLEHYITEYETLPFDALSYLVGECNYGGRVTDEWDRRCLTTILHDFLNNDVITNPNYILCQGFSLPPQLDYEGVIAFIKDLPVNYSPEVLGLHANAGIRRDYQTSMVLLQSASLVEGKGGKGVETEDSAVASITKEILSKLPEPFDIEAVLEKYPNRFDECMNAVLYQDLKRFNKLLLKIVATLKDVQNVVQGLVAISPQLEIVFDYMAKNKVPKTWMEVSYPSLKSLSGYIQDLTARLIFFKQWVDFGIPESFWLPGFFFTQAFLTGIKQNYSRKYRIPIERIVFDFFVLESDVGAVPVPDDGAHCYGLFLEGARWNSSLHTLDEQKPKILYENLPTVWLKPMRKDLVDDGRTSSLVQRRYDAPLYKTLERKGVLSTTGHSTNFVLAILLDTQVPPSHWVKRSVALFCQLD